VGVEKNRTGPLRIVGGCWRSGNSFFSFGIAVGLCPLVSNRAFGRRGGGGAQQKVASLPSAKRGGGGGGGRQGGACSAMGLAGLGGLGQLSFGASGGGDMGGAHPGGAAAATKKKKRQNGPPGRRGGKKKRIKTGFGGSGITRVFTYLPTQGGGAGSGGPHTAEREYLGGLFKKEPTTPVLKKRERMRARGGGPGM